MQYVPFLAAFGILTDGPVMVHQTAMDLDVLESEQVPLNLFQTKIQNYDKSSEVVWNNDTDPVTTVFREYIIVGTLKNKVRWPVIHKRNILLYNLLNIL